MISPKFLLLLWIWTITIEARYTDEFQHFMKKFSKQYPTEEEMSRRSDIFATNLELIERFNREDAAKNITYAINEFADLTDNEWKQFLMSSKPGKNDNIPKIKPFSSKTLPVSVDWRNDNGTNHVTNIKYQGPCGSCWAFATAAAIESAVSIRGGALENLSAQELLDCTPISDKCGGGEPSEALAYARDHGVTLARLYPYYFISTTCKTDLPVAAKISGWVAAESEDEMAGVLANNGPMIVCANFATNKNRFYHSGIAEDAECGIEPTHALIVIGYGPDYWLLKNSYSKIWGENGYMRVKRGVNWCGIMTEKPLLPIL
uniref:Uncharacterized protein n=1 Tax=Caenorhabditis japonica TaxID=281687 RepID=A0A8R1HKF9_CAEJA